MGGGDILKIIGKIDISLECMVFGSLRWTVTVHSWDGGGRG